VYASIPTPEVAANHVGHIVPGDRCAKWVVGTGTGVGQATDNILVVIRDALQYAVQRRDKHFESLTIVSLGHASHCGLHVRRWRNPGTLVNSGIASNIDKCQFRLRNYREINAKITIDPGRRLVFS
jgi:hypothetical protein